MVLRPRSYIPIFDPSQLPLQQLDPLALSEDDGTQSLHFCEQLVQEIVLKEARRQGISQRAASGMKNVSCCRLTSFFGLSAFPSVSFVDTRGCGTSSSVSLAAEVDVDVGAATLPAEDEAAPVPESCETSWGLPRRVSLCLDVGAVYPPLRDTNRGGASCPEIHSSARRAGSKPAVSG